MGKGVLGGATYQLHKCLTNMSSPPHIFLKYQLQNLKGREEFVQKMFQAVLTHPCTICVPSSRSSFLDDCRKSRGDHVVGLVTCSSAPISKQRVSQRTNNKHLLPSSHRVGEKQEQTRGKKGKSETQLICQAPQSLLPPGRERESLLSRQLSRLKM